MDTWTLPTQFYNMFYTHTFFDDERMLQVHSGLELQPRLHTRTPTTMLTTSALLLLLLLLLLADI